MGKPVWVTRAGNLGTLEEGVFYELLMEGYDPDGGELEYKVIAGYMPPGLVMNERTGVVSGRPKDLYFVRGVPFEVNQDVTSTFCCRLTSTDGKIADRTFSITITGQDNPTIITPEQQLAQIFDGTYVEIQLEALDLDQEPITWKVNAGELPPGLTLDPNTGLISGYAEPVSSVASESTIGWDASGAGWSEFPWSHSPAWINQNYQFTVEITDGKEYSQRSYSIFVLSKSLLTADLDTLTADSDNVITADMDNTHRPALITKPADLGIYEHDNYFAYRFKGNDFDFDEIEFGIVSGDGNGFDSILGTGFDSELFDQGGLSIPLGLTLNPETGWLYGYINSQIEAQNEYSFAVYVYKKNNPEVRSELVYFTITVVGSLANAIIWQTPTNLGTILTGSISELAIVSTNSVGRNVQYSLESGGSLPQGLRLLPSGLIVGRATFEYTSFDKGATTFDENVRELGARLAPVTFDRQYIFTVRAASANNELLAFKTFTIQIVPSDFEPYESLYLRANPGQLSKDLFQSIVRNTDIIPGKDVYRNEDPYFGRAQDARLLLLSGLAAAPAEEYIAAMGINHYRKVLKFGEPKVSKNYDINQNVVYEVLYYELYDDSETLAGSVSTSIDLTNKINRNITIDASNVTLDSTYYTMDGAGDRIVYTNSLVNMRRQIMNTIGMGVREVLPLWMSNRQADGSVIGWKPVIILAYMKPGTGDRALFNLKRRTDLDKKLISLEFDRYIWDNNLSKTYDAVTGEYLTSAETTFDVDIDFVNPDPVATVDFALDVPFNQIDGRLTDYIDNLGGLDGITTVYEGKTVIFATQEQFTGYNEPNDGWIRNSTFWDNESGWDNQDQAGWDDYELIDGYQEKQADPINVTNQRAGVWLIVRDSETGLLRLELQQEIDPDQTIYVRTGFKYGGYLLKYDGIIKFSEGKTVPYYKIAEAAEQNQRTTFDNNNTRFITNIVTYEDPDQSDKYLVFPRENIWA